MPLRDAASQNRDAAFFFGSVQRLWVWQIAAPFWGHFGAILLGLRISGLPRLYSVAFSGGLMGNQLGFEPHLISTLVEHSPFCALRASFPMVKDALACP